ncbi:MAG: isoprenylcysteine carboxylmethyltransferase family protein [Terracidiphilus sp.]
MKLNYGTLAFLTIVVLILLINASRFPWTVSRIAGVSLFIPSFLLFALARIQLGQSFSVEAKATRLVTTGLYSRIRNPIYFFAFLMIAGVIVWTGHPLGLLIFVVLVPLQVFRVRKEEKVLTEKFGTAYLDYKRKTWF